MKNKVFKSVIFMFLVLTCLCTSKAFAYTSCCSGPTYEIPFAKMTAEKHYVSPGNIIFSGNGLFLTLQGNLIPINSVETDQDGVFICTMAYPYGTCPNCHFPLTPGGTCLNPRCPLSPLYDPDYE